MEKRKGKKSEADGLAPNAIDCISSATTRGLAIIVWRRKKSLGAEATRIGFPV
jgi:hypothetical protein